MVKPSGSSINDFRPTGLLNNLEEIDDFYQLEQPSIMYARVSIADGIDCKTKPSVSS